MFVKYIYVVIFVKIINIVFIVNIVKIVNLVCDYSSSYQVAKLQYFVIAIRMLFIGYLFST